MPSNTPINFSLEKKFLKVKDSKKYLKISINQKDLIALPQF